MIPSLEGPPRRVLSDQDREEMQALMVRLLLCGAHKDCPPIETIRSLLDVGTAGPGALIHLRMICDHAERRPPGEALPTWLDAPGTWLGVNPYR